MDKIILLDWDGPISNSRTWKMPSGVDPVAVRLLNVLTAAGWQLVLTSTIRKNFWRDAKTEAEARQEATAHKVRAGIFPQWYHSWCTDPDFTSKRHLEVAQWMMNTPFDADAVFLVIDDEAFPPEFLQGGRMRQLKADSSEGLGHQALHRGFSLVDMTDAELEKHFALPDDDEEDEDGL